MGSIPIKLVILGDDQVGKTSLFMTYTSGIFPHGYCPTVFEQEGEQEITINGTPVTLTLNDVPNHPDYAARVRFLHYYNTDVFLLCFSLVCLSSYKSICNNWFPEINVHCPNTPILLVGTKLDLLDDEPTLTRLKDEEQSVPITSAEGIHMCKEINAVKYMECSSITQKGLKAVIEEAVSIGINNKPSESMG